MEIEISLLRQHIKHIYNQYNSGTGLSPRSGGEKQTPGDHDVSLSMRRHVQTVEVKEGRYSHRLTMLSIRNNIFRK